MIWCQSNFVFNFLIFPTSINVCRVKILSSLKLNPDSKTNVIALLLTIKIIMVIPLHICREINLSLDMINTDFSELDKFPYAVKASQLISQYVPE